MKKKILALALTAFILMAQGCNNFDKSNTDQATKEPKEENGGIQNQHIELEENQVVFRGKVTDTTSKKYIVIEIIDSRIAFGTYHVLTGSETLFFDKNGKSIERDDIKTGDVIEVVFGGQVMNSYPPQISARKIYLN
jgi:hypothetical protein